MLLIQMTGLSGAGKSTIAQATKTILTDLGYKVELLDGDDYRKHLCRDLGFSKSDRLENIHRLGFVGLTLAKHGIISILAAINPYEEARKNLQEKKPFVKTVFISCPLSITSQRDPKGLYRRAFLPEEHPDYIGHFTGISDPFEPPQNPDLILHTDTQTVEVSAKILVDFILEQVSG
jgi:adenylylsulfate kinase